MNQISTAFLKEMRRVVSPWWAGFCSPRRTGKCGPSRALPPRSLTIFESLLKMSRRKIIQSEGFTIHAVYGQDLLRPGKFYGRRILNVLKKMDVLRLRRFLGADIVDNIDTKTQPIARSGDVTPLGPEDKASIVLFVCERSIGS